MKKWESLKLLMTILLTLALQTSALRSEGWSFFGGSWWLQKFLRQPNATSTCSLKPHHRFTTNQFTKVTKRESSNVHAARTPRRVNELLSHVLSTIPPVYNQVSPLLIPLECTFTRSLRLFCSFSTRILSTQSHSVNISWANESFLFFSAQIPSKRLPRLFPLTWG